jgi:hypothetical protein
LGRVGTASSRRHLTRDLDAVERADLRRLLDSAARARLRGEELGRCGRCETPWFLRTRGCPARTVTGSAASGPAVSQATLTITSTVAWLDNESPAFAGLS